MKASRIFALTAVVALAITLSACDIIEGPKKDLDNLAAASDNVVLLEEWTGHTCGNCPKSHVEAKNLEAIYDSNIVIVSIHSGFFAKTNSEYPTDYTTPMGNAVDAYFGADVAGFPKGMINRKAYNGFVLHGFADWGTHIAAALAETPEMSIDITNSYDSTSRTVSIEVDMEYFIDGTITDNLVVVLTEDSVVSPQKDYDSIPDKIENYVHRHVLRDAVTAGHWGEQISGAGISAGDQIKKTFTYVIPQGFDPKHCAIVAFVADDSTKEIRQAAQAYVTSDH